MMMCQSHHHRQRSFRRNHILRELEFCRWLRDDRMPEYLHVWREGMKDKHFQLRNLKSTVTAPPLPTKRDANTASRALNY